MPKLSRLTINNKPDIEFISDKKLFMLKTFCKMLEISYDDIEKHNTSWLKKKIRQYKLKILENE